MVGSVVAMNDERDELDAFLDAGRARFGGVALAVALDEAATWAETRAARRHRVARAWIAGGVLAGLLGGGTAVAAAMVDPPEPVAVPTSIMLSYASDNGASCNIEVEPVVQSADPAAWAIAHSYLSTADAPPVDLNSLLAGGSAGDREIDALTDELSQGAENEILRRLGARVDVVLRSEYSCSVAPVAGDDYSITPPIVGDDFGREPTQLGGRAPHVVAFFRASTGQICEIQMKVDPDPGSGATEADGALAARAYLASVDFTTVDYSIELRRMADFWPPDYDPGQAEASALSQTVSEQMILTLAPAGGYLPITIESWSGCDPEPAE
jgi:hypothetical protein